MNIVVIGGGVAGLATALQLGRPGHTVTVIERDDTPMPATADEAFDWNRRGAPQVRHSHAFLARLRNLLRDHQPDILDALLAEGATEMRFGDGVPAEMEFEPEPGDDDLVMIACRRTTFEWVLRRAALAEANVTIRTGLAAVGLLASEPDAATPNPNPKLVAKRAPGDRIATSFGVGPTVTGVRLDDGSELLADLVVAANGRRSAVADWLAEIGARPVTETVEDTGIVYASRFYRLLPDAEVPPRTGPIGGDLGYVKYGTFVGDNRTFSITLAVPTGDDELRRRLADPVAFDAAARSLPATAPWLDGRAEPITPEVHMMAGLLNKWSDYVVDGEPAAIGLVPVGDAVLCTNPLYGRGCSTAYWSAQLLAQAIADASRRCACCRRRLRRSAAHGDPSVVPLVGRAGPRGSSGGCRVARRRGPLRRRLRPEGLHPVGAARRTRTGVAFRPGRAAGIRPQPQPVVATRCVADRRRLRCPRVRRAADQGRAPSRTVARPRDQSRLRRHPPRRLTRAR